MTKRRPHAQPELMTIRRALLLAGMALDAVAHDAPDLREWSEAAKLVRGLLQRNNQEAQHGS